MISNDVCDFLQKVPEATDEVFRLGAGSPASVLLDAVEQLDQKSPKADDNIQLIRPNLTEAVDTCVSLSNDQTTTTLILCRSKPLAMNSIFIIKNNY